MIATSTIRTLPKWLTFSEELAPEYGCYMNMSAIERNVIKRLSHGRHSLKVDSVKLLLSCFQSAVDRLRQTHLTARTRFVIWKKRSKKMSVVSMEH